MVINELLVVDIWKDFVFPVMLHQPVVPITSFPAYLVVSNSCDKNNTVPRVSAPDS